MSVLIDQLLELARFESEKITPALAPCDLIEIINSISSRLDNSLKNGNKSIELIKNVSGIVMSDSSMTEIMLENIISNSIKYSPQGSVIKIELIEDKDILLCSVTDSGNGIAEDQIPKIFDRFYRVDESRNSQISGKGIGLAIVKRLADLQNIPINVQSQVSVGTTFTFRFSR